jgi:hypothetical protein
MSDHQRLCSDYLWHVAWSMNAHAARTCHPIFETGFVHITVLVHTGKNFCPMPVQLAARASQAV